MAENPNPKPNNPNLPHVSYLPAPTLKSPQSKKQKISNPSSLTHTLPPPHSPNSNTSSPTKMDQQAMDIHIREERLNSLDALVTSQILDQCTSSDDDFHDIDIDLNNSDIYPPIKHTHTHADTDTPVLDNDKLIALINSHSGARKGWILARELSKYDASVYHLKDLSTNQLIRHKLAQELVKHRNKCLVLICGGDGSNAWASALIDESIQSLDTDSTLPFPPIAVFPMGTGNDLSRCLGWGNFEPNAKNILKSIADIKFCSKITKRWSDLDRWRVTYTFDHIPFEHIRDDICNTNERKYEITPPKQFYTQSHPHSQTYKEMHRFDPPLPSTFLCYLSIGYDALVAYKFEKERRAHPERFNNQIKNQVIYVKHGFTEFFKPSEPILDSVDVTINNKDVALPNGCRSLKVININSAMNGLFFWGNGKSRDFEYKQSCVPQLDDGKIEVMATKGVHDMMLHRVNVSHAQRISQCNDIILRFKRIPKSGIALQIDGEAWIIRQKCTLRVQIHDKLPVVVGYNQPRGVQSWLMASLNDASIVKAKESYRERLREKYAKNENVFDSPNSSDDDKDKNVIDKLLNQSSNSILSLFNINKGESEEKESANTNTDLFDKIGGFLKNGKEKKSPKSPKDGIFLDRFAWWKVTREKNMGKAIDAETATDAIKTPRDSRRYSRKTQSFMVLPNNGASLF